VRGEKLAHLTLAEGEATGHAHRVTDGVAALYEFEDKKYLQIQSELAMLTHEEHKALQIPEGNYEIKIQKDRGAAGHNGIKSIIESLGTQDFYRVRIGVASPNEKKMQNTAKFVLGKFSLLEKKRLNKAIEGAVAEITKLF